VMQFLLPAYNIAEAMLWEMPEAPDFRSLP